MTNETFYSITFETVNLSTYDVCSIIEMAQHEDTEFHFLDFKTRLQVNTNSRQVYREIYNYKALVQCAIDRQNAAA